MVSLTGKVMEAKRPDLILIKKETKGRQVIDMAVPGGTRVGKQEDQKSWSSSKDDCGM